MVIDSLNIYPAKVDRKFPFRTSQAVQNHVNGVFIEVKTKDGYVGVGEAAPRRHITGETLEQTFSDICSIGQSLIGLETEEALQIIYEDLTLSKKPAVSYSLEMSLLDILSSRKDLPLCDYLSNLNISQNGMIYSDKKIKPVQSSYEFVEVDNLCSSYQVGECPSHFSISETKNLDYCGLIGSEITGRKLKRKLSKKNEGGYKTIRVKVGELSLDEDLSRLQIMRDQLGETNLWIDVNQGWSLDQALGILPYLESLNISMIEQPLNRYDLEGHKTMKNSTNIPIMLDESIQSREDLELTILNGYADAVNLKFMKLGSFPETKKLAQLAHSNGLEVYCGGSAVTEVFASYARHIEFAVSELTYFSSGKIRNSSLKEPISYPDMVYSPHHPFAKRPSSPGLGVKLIPEVLKKYIPQNLEVVELK